MESTQEFEITYTLKERYYLTAHKEQRVERTLICHRQGYVGDLMATEDYYSASQEGSLRLFVQWIEAAYSENPPKDTQIIQFDSSEEQQRRATLWLIAATVVAIVLTVLILTFCE